MVHSERAWSRSWFGGLRKPINGSTQEPGTPIELVSGGAQKVVGWVLRELHFSLRVLEGGSQKGDTDAELGHTLMNPGKKGQFRLTMGDAASVPNSF